MWKCRDGINIGGFNVQELQLKQDLIRSIKNRAKNIQVLRMWKCRARISIGWLNVQENTNKNKTWLGLELGSNCNLEVGSSKK